MRFFCVAVLGGLLGIPTLAKEAPPRLAVVISVDQMRSDYLARFRPYFGEGGFKRLLEGGAEFRNCFYRHGYTKTAPGHATILSGVNANVHGIIGNEWLHPVTFESGNSVEDVNSPLVGLPPRADRYPPGPWAAKSGRSPRNYLGVTVGDRLKEKYGDASKVFGVADKDRSAILMAGRKADGAYWTEEGLFVTSTYYRKELPAWAQAFNQERNATHYFGQVWERLLDPAIYDRVQGPDDAPGESSGSGLNRVFPKKIDGGRATIGGTFYDAFDFAPWGNDLVAAMAERLLEAEQLGQDDVPDLLCVGFSQTDKVGHGYGPASHEVMDSYLRLDRVLAEFFQFLDQRVGAGRWVVVITADHGICPLPEQTRAERGPEAAARVPGRTIDVVVKAGLDAAYGELPEGAYWAVRDGTSYRLNPRALVVKRLEARTVAEKVRDIVAAQPHVAEAWTRAQLTGYRRLGEYGERMKLSFNATRSGDVVFILEPWFFLSSMPAGTDHGSPYDYDSHVPQLWYGAGVKPGVHDERIATEDLAPTMAHLLGVRLPRAAKGKVVVGK